MIPTEITIQWQPYFAPAVIAAVSVVVAVLAAVAYRRNFPQRPIVGSMLLAMRWFFIAAVALLLMGPSVMPPPAVSEERPCLTIVLDTSASMQVADVEGQSRYRHAVQHWLEARQLASWRERMNVRVMTFDAKPRVAEPANLRPPEGDETRLIEGLLAILGDMTSGSGALLLLSDGRDTQSRPAHEAVQLARAKSLPIFAVPLGGPSLQRDIALAALPMQEYLLAKEEGQIRVTIAHTGVRDSATMLRLRCDGRELMTQPIHFDGSEPVTVMLPVRQEEPGHYEYEVSIDPVEGEIESRNNHRTLFVSVTAGRLKVLLLEGRPHWETKFLAQSLRKDDRLELTQIAEVAVGERERIVTRSEARVVEVPRTREQWRHYDVVILGRGLEHLLDAASAALLTRFVGEDGGHVIFSRGRASDVRSSHGAAVAEQLAVLDPVWWPEDADIRPLSAARGNDDVRLRLSAAGQSHPVFEQLASQYPLTKLFAETPWIRIQRVAGEKPAAVTLLRGDRDGEPVLLTMDYGRGSVLCLLGEGLWQWRLGPKEQEAAASAYDRLWSNMIRWLVVGGDFQPGQQVTLRLWPRSAPLGEKVNLMLTGRYLSGALAAQLTIIAPSGERHQPALIAAEESDTRLSAMFEPRLLGVHDVIVQTPGLTPARHEARFEVFDISQERLHTAANPSLMRELAEQTGGQVLDPNEPQSLLPAYQRHQAVMRVPIEPVYIWNRVWILMGVLVWAGCEWMLRRLGGGL